MATGNPIIVEKDIYDLLDSQGYLTSWSSFIGFMPDKGSASTYNECITVNSFGGMPTNYNKILRPNFQILVRSKDYQTAREKSQNILDYLMNFGEHEQQEFTINGHHYTVLIALQTSPADIGKDERGRFLFSFNFNCIVEHDNDVLLGTTSTVLFGTTGNVLYGTLSEAIDG